MVSFNELPLHLILQIGSKLNAKDLHILMRVNKPTTDVLKPLLEELALKVQYARSAISVYSRNKNMRMVERLLNDGDMSTVTRYWFTFGIQSEYGNKGFHRTPSGVVPPRDSFTIDEWRTNENLMHLELPREFLRPRAVVAANSGKRGGRKGS